MKIKLDEFVFIKWTKHPGGDPPEVPGCRSAGAGTQSWSTRAKGCLLLSPTAVFHLISKASEAQPDRDTERGLLGQGTPGGRHPGAGRPWLDLKACWAALGGI